MGAATTTTPAGKVIPGKLEKKKPITEIMLAHDMQYVATATPYYWKDMLTKVRKGLEVEGPAFLHIFAPCPRGWRTEPAKPWSTQSLSVESCVFPIWEAVKRQTTTFNTKQTNRSCPAEERNQLKITLKVKADLDTCSRRKTSMCSMKFNSILMNTGKDYAEMRASLNFLYFV